MDAWWALTTRSGSFLAVPLNMNALEATSCRAVATDEEHASRTDCGQEQHQLANVSSNLTGVSYL